MKTKKINVKSKKKKRQSYLVGAGLAELDGVRARGIVLPNAEMPSLPVTLVIAEPVTDNRDGRCELLPPLGVVEPSRRCGIRDGVASSVLSNDNDEPWRDGGLEPGREFGFEPPGVKPRLGVYDGLRGVYRPPKLLSLSLSESGVDADNDERDGRDMATERADFSRTCWLFVSFSKKTTEIAEKKTNNNQKQKISNINL